jgi:N-acetylglutamate synthase/N-acetylornithine aminotransferase
MGALGYSAARVVEDKVDIGYSQVGSRKVLWSLKRGRPTAATFRQLCDLVKAKEFELRVHLNLGKAGAVVSGGDV